MSTTLRVSDATGQRACFWRQTREALAEQPGVEIEDHDVFAPALSDGLDRG